VQLLCLSPTAQQSCFQLVLGFACRSVQAPRRHWQPGPVSEAVSVCRQVWELHARWRRQGLHQRGAREGVRRQLLARAVHSRSGERRPSRSANATVDWLLTYS
jgi:hypothetical protein